MTMGFKILAVLLLVLEATDGFLTMWATNHGFQEINKLIEPVSDTWLLPLLKVGTTILGIAILIPLGKRFPRLTEFGLGAALFFIIIVLTTNFYEMAV